MAVKYAVYAVLALALFDLSFAFQAGAPEGTCETLYPKHGVDAQTSTSPYKIGIDKTKIRAGEKITVTIKSTNEPFKGFILQARDSSNNTLGTFEKVAGSKLLNCKTGKSVSDVSLLIFSSTFSLEEIFMYFVFFFFPQNAVTHANSDAKQEITIPWTSPSNLKKSFYFM